MKAIEFIQEEAFHLTIDCPWDIGAIEDSKEQYANQRVIEELMKSKDIETIIEKLNEELKDTEYRRAWISNIAIAQIDCERWYREENNKVGKYLNKKDRHAIANKGAEYFIELLSK